MPTEKTYDRILAYLKGMFSERQRHDLEKEMMRDVFDEEAFEGLSRLSAEDLQADLDKLENSLQDRITQSKKRNLKIYFRIAAGILLLAGLTGLLYVVFRSPANNLISKEEVRKAEPKSIEPSAPLMETESAPQETFKKEMTRVQKSKIPAAKPTAVPEKDKEMAAPIIDTISVNDEMLAQEEVEVLSYADKKVKNIEKPLTNEPGPDKSVRAEQALQGQAAGVQVSSRSEYESPQLNKEQVYPELSKPIPPGGSLKAYKKWVNDRLDYTAYKDFPGKHKITVEINVRSDGTISNIRVSQSTPDVMAADLKKVISQSSIWSPALEDHNPVDADVVIHFVITVE
jgi:hypothetical protein